jgi:hypothetical protein
MVSPAGENVTEAVSITEAVAPKLRLASMTTKVSRRHTGKSKKDQLLDLIAKPAGTKISVLTERLGWQTHTVRAALSGLRKQGHEILANKAPKTGEAVYRLVLPKPVKADGAQVAASKV